VGFRARRNDAKDNDRASESVIVIASPPSSSAHSTPMTAAHRWCSLAPVWLIGVRTDLSLGLLHGVVNYRSPCHADSRSRINMIQLES
jgi:hypothetical protein